MHLNVLRTSRHAASNRPPRPPNSDPDSVAFCVLATDQEHACDIALQIHFTLIQAFCFDNDINVVRVTDIERLADLVGADEGGEPKDAHCILVTVRSWLPPHSDRN